jgi:hypothetical protein
MEALPIIAGVLIGVLAFVGFIVYFAFAIVVMTNEKLRANSYYILTVSIGIADMGFLVITFAYSAPGIVLQTVFGRN